MADEALVAAALATGAGALLQSAGGFGFALVASPALFAAFEPAEAVGAVLVLGIGLNALVLAGERGRPPVRWGDVGPMLAAAVPGLAAGVLVLELLAKEALQALVGVGVLAAVAVRAGRPRPARAGARYPVGFLAGALTTSTSVSGPPLVLWLRALGAAPAELRASLAASFLSLNVLGGVILALAIGGRGSPGADVLLALAPAAALGHVAGRLVFTRLPRSRFEALGTTVVVAAGLASLAAAAF